MSRSLYCWRCDMDIPMLDEDEWAKLAPLLDAAIENIKRYRLRHEAALGDVPIPEMYWAASEMYSKLTGVDVISPDALWRHRLSLYGPPCVACGKPLRTPQAKLCAACGHPRPLPAAA